MRGRTHVISSHTPFKVSTLTVYAYKMVYGNHLSSTGIHDVLTKQNLLHRTKASLVSPQRRLYWFKRGQAAIDWKQGELGEFLSPWQSWRRIARLTASSLCSEDPHPSAIAKTSLRMLAVARCLASRSRVSKYAVGPLAVRRALATVVNSGPS